MYLVQYSGRSLKIFGLATLQRVKTSLKQLLLSLPPFLAAERMNLLYVRNLNAS